MKPPKPKRRVPPPPALQLINVIDEVCEAEALAEENEFDAQLRVSAMRVELVRHARQYAYKLARKSDNPAPEKESNADAEAREIKDALKKY